MAADAKAHGLQVLQALFPDQAVRDARMAELGEAGLELLGNTAMMRADYSRAMNETAAERQKAQELYTANEQWYADRKADLEELDRLRKGLKPGDGDPSPRPDPARPDPAKPAESLTKAELLATLEQTERGAVAFFTDLNRISLEHFQRFGEILDTDALIRHPQVQKVGLRGVYSELHKEQLQAKAAEAQKAAEDKIRADERAKIAAEQGASHHPYPVRGNEPSTLDGIKPAESTAAASVDAMVSEYTRLQAVRSV